MQRRKDDARPGVAQYFLMFLVVALLLPLAAPTAGAEQQANEYFTEKTVTLPEGKTLAQLIIHGPPVPPPGFEIERQSVALPTPDKEKGINVLQVPAFDWVLGCSAVSGAMIAGFHDRNGFGNIYTGPTNGGITPLDNSSWGTWSDGVDTYPNCPLIASHDGVDGRVGRGSIGDYWVRYDSADDDPYLTGGWTQHFWEDAIGDYMKTSQSAYFNTDGATTFYTWTNSAAPLTCADLDEAEIDNDGTQGRKQFYEARGYTVTDCYNQRTDNMLAGGFSFAQFKAEIDAGRPVLLNLAGHSIVGVGYNDASNVVYIHDTWDYLIHTMTWGTSYAGMQLRSVSIVNVTATYTVTFESNGGTDVPSQTVAPNGKATKPADPTREGYTFAGWYSDVDLTTLFDFNTPIDGDITLYAKWNRFFTVSGMVLDGSITGPPLVGAKVALGSKWVTTSDTGAFTLTGIVAGSYTLTISKTGYVPKVTTGYGVNADQADLVLFLVSDTTAPTVTVFAIPATSTSLSVPITTFTATDNIAVTGYLVTESSTKPLAGDTRWRASKPTSYSCTTYGTKNLYAWAKDAVGNVSASLNDKVTVVDTVPPKTAFSIPSGSPFMTVSFTIFTATDNVGVTGYLLTESHTTPLASDPRWRATKPTSYTFTSFGRKQLYAYAKDAAGNVSIPHYGIVTIYDATPPTVTAFDVPSTSTSFKVPILTFTATDNYGVTGYLVTITYTKPPPWDPRWRSIKPVSYIFNSFGAKRLYAWAKDVAGNVSLSRSDTVTIYDGVSPAVTAFTIPSASYSLTVPILTFTATDNVGVKAYLLTQTATKPLAGDLRWKTTKPVSYTFTSTGLKTLYAWVKDAAGNVSASRYDTVTITLR